MKDGSTSLDMTEAASASRFNCRSSFPSRDQIIFWIDNLADFSEAAFFEHSILQRARRLVSDLFVDRKQAGDTVWEGNGVCLSQIGKTA